MTVERTGRWLPLRRPRIVLSLRAAVRVREIDRQLQRVRLARRALVWVVTPACLGIFGYVVRQLAATGHALTAELVLGIAIPVAMCLVGILRASTEAADRCRDLEEERTLLADGSMDPHLVGRTVSRKDGRTGGRTGGRTEGAPDSGDAHPAGRP